jgi:hypothetical protein
MGILRECVKVSSIIKQITFYMTDRVKLVIEEDPGNRVSHSDIVDVNANDPQCGTKYYKTREVSGQNDYYNAELQADGSMIWSIDTPLKDFDPNQGTTTYTLVPGSAGVYRRIEDDKVVPVPDTFYKITEEIINNGGIFVFDREKDDYVHLSGDFLRNIRDKCPNKDWIIGGSFTLLRMENRTVTLGNYHGMEYIKSEDKVDDKTAEWMVGPPAPEKGCMMTIPQEFYSKSKDGKFANLHHCQTSIP